ncbi:urease accessory protein UreF [Novispirillum sp. DQ9]|uniref:urease accessory protein UreF n=1 Tax=Novispirillum sp. DQ9 TaxID=3398612 RepID=UPI003C7D14EA
MPTPTDPASLYRLMTWLSPAFPVGAFTYSHGLEWAVEDGRVRDFATLTAWVEGVVVHGAGRTDADLFREAWQAVADGDRARFARAAEWADALRGSAEMALESANQGRAFLDCLGKAWPHPDLEAWAPRPVAYAVAVALAAALNGVPLRAALIAFLHALSANLISAAVRLVPLGQTDGQKAQAALAPVIARAVDDALARTWDDLGAAAPLIDLTSMAHETQYSRMFRS